jgi:PAS domain S-box-containing protein
MPIKHSSGILVVDDEPDSSSVLKRILAAEGYHVRTADSGSLALASLDAWSPELILLDIRMEGINGFEVCRRLKTSEKSRNLPVIFISAASELEERVKGLELGAVDYISKPFQREELLARVRTHLELARFRNQLEQLVLERTAELGSAVDRIRESEERFRNMADTAPVLIWVSGTDRLCTFVNETWLAFTGHSIGEELGGGWTRRVHPDDLERCLEIYTSAFDARRNFEVECRLLRADGEFRWILSKGVPRFGPSGAFAGYIGSAVDITDLKRTQEEALAREKLQSLTSLTRGIAHDFNNMVGSILAQAELVESDLAEGSAAVEEVRQIKAVAIRASEIVHQLMIYSGQEETKLDDVDLTSVVEEMSKLLQVSISKHASLRLDLSKDLPLVWGNAVQIRQLVMNLIMNASQAIGEKNGVIHVETSLHTGGAHSAPDHASNSGDYVRLAVSDTGCGITPEEKARIFDPFFTTKPQGHGLGLAVVRAIVRAHNGEINLQSTPGEGSTFEVLFRCAAGHSGVARSADFVAHAQELASVRGIILLVDDEDPLRIATATALQKRGFSVLAVVDGCTAVETFQSRRDDIGVVLLDWTLPGLSGQEVFRRIRTINPDIKVIFTSAYDPRVAEGAALGQGDATFLQKPYTFSDLIAHLDRPNREKSCALQPRAAGTI